MRSNDELDAIKALAYRLTEWGVDEPAAKAEQYIDDLVRRGWAMSAHVRPIRRPPMRHEECATHPGEYRDLCRACIADRKAAHDHDTDGPRETWTPERIRQQLHRTEGTA